jgi:hypothetical protein
MKAVAASKYCGAGIAILLDKSQADRALGCHLHAYKGAAAFLSFCLGAFRKRSGKTAYGGLQGARHESSCSQRPVASLALLQQWICPTIWSRREWVNELGDIFAGLKSTTRVRIVTRCSHDSLFPLNSPSDKYRCISTPSKKCHCASLPSRFILIMMNLQFCTS